MSNQEVGLEWSYYSFIAQEVPQFIVKYDAQVDQNKRDKMRLSQLNARGNHLWDDHVKMAKSKENFKVINFTNLTNEVLPPTSPTIWSPGL